MLWGGRGVGVGSGGAAWSRSSVSPCGKERSDEEAQRCWRLEQNHDSHHHHHRNLEQEDLFGSDCSRTGDVRWFVPSPWTWILLFCLAKTALSVQSKRFGRLTLNSKRTEAERRHKHGDRWSELISLFCFDLLSENITWCLLHYSQLNSEFKYFSNVGLLKHQLSHPSTIGGFSPPRYWWRN